jgi:hypothetical protein
MKTPIERRRESAMRMDVGGTDDASPITSMFAIGDHLHVVKEKSIYEVRLADDIDPQRTNIAACPCRNSNPRVLMVQAAENRLRLYASY